ncbi:MAG: hypothetical protein QOD77_1565 [Thermoplasmata archaeon]|nr:hypothetical protein [Thermoplasmata archaeon]
MKRHPALQDLSRDHHTLLLHAQRLQQGADTDPQTALKAARNFLSYWTGACIDHLDEESQFVVPQSSDSGIQGRFNMLEEVLREAADGLRVSMMDPTYFRPALRACAEALRAHVTFCEANLFMDVQDRLGDRIQALGNHMTKFRKERRPQAIGPDAQENCYL